MRKKVSLLVLIIVFTGLVSGCEKSLEISEESSDVIADYMASTVMKYQVSNTNMYKYYAPDYNPNSKQEETEVEEEKTDNENDKNSTDNNQIDAAAELEKQGKAICTIMGLDGCSMKTVSFKNIDAYIEDGSYEIRPEEGKKLYQLDLLITNTSQKDVKIDLLKNNSLKIQLEIEEKSFLPLFTVAENDIITLSTVIKASGEQKVVVFYQLDKEMPINTAYFKVSSGENTAQIKVK